MEGLRSVEFKRILEEAFGNDVAGRALDGLEQPASVSVRVNPSKVPDGMLPLVEGARPVPWSRHGFLLSERPSFTLDPLLHAGCYYVQDSSAMFVGEMFRMVADSLPQMPRVLDLCAAPGGKTTDLAASLRQLRPDGFFLVANEVMKQRAGVLADNVSLWGDPYVAVTSADPKAYARMEAFFDAVVADVPCSGEGMFRKDARAVEEWSLETVALCEARQRRIIADMWPALADGGLLVYSTCTFNIRENDGNVRWIADNLGADIIEVEMPYPGVIKTECGWSLVPGLVPGEGQYCAVLRKKGGSPRQAANPRKALKDQYSKQFGHLLSEPSEVLLKGDTLIAVPKKISAEAGMLAELHPLQTGVAMGVMKGPQLVPGADLALSLLLGKDAWPQAELDIETALKYLHRDTISLPEVEKGFVRVCFGGHPLGFVKNLGGRCNNLHPAGRRIRMDI